MTQKAIFWSGIETVPDMKESVGTHIKGLDI
jgi:hypothetical protein